MLRRLARWVGLVAAVAAASTLLVPPASASKGASVVSLNALARGVAGEINAFRSDNGLPPLRLSASLTDAAKQHSLEMAQDGYFAHASADGDAFWQRIASFYGSDGWGYWSVGENLLWSSPDVNPDAALQDWLESPAHRANILDPRWREIGIAAVHTSAAPGTYQGQPVTIVTTDFGVRR